MSHKGAGVLTVYSKHKVNSSVLSSEISIKVVEQPLNKAEYVSCATTKEKNRLSRRSREIKSAAVSELTLAEMFGTRAASRLPVISNPTELPDVPPDG